MGADLTDWLTSRYTRRRPRAAAGVGESRKHSDRQAFRRPVLHAESALCRRAFVIDAYHLWRYSDREQRARVIIWMANLPALIKKRHVPDTR